MNTSATLSAPQANREHAPPVRTAASPSDVPPILVTNHARQRLNERFPQLARMLATPHTVNHWLRRQCERAEVLYRYNSSSELRTITIAHVSGPIEVVLATRRNATAPGDVLATVLTRQFADNLINGHCEAWCGPVALT
jgi:hypothetical protein